MAGDSAETSNKPNKSFYLIIFVLFVFSRIRKIFHYFIALGIEERAIVFNCFIYNVTFSYKFMPFVQKSCGK
jgi:hypothetical protein